MPGNKQEPPILANEESAWPTNGGPLGCLIGALAGVLLGAFLGTTLLIPFRLIGISLTICLTVSLAVVGWRVGGRIFREYNPPKRGADHRKVRSASQEQFNSGAEEYNSSAPGLGRSSSERDNS